MISKGNENELFKLQKQCLCYIYKIGPSASLKDEYLKHGLVRFPDMIKIELCKLGHKTTKDNIPKPLKSIVDKRRGKKQHGHNTQNKNTPNVQVHTTTQINQSYLCRSIVEYSKLPQTIKDMPTHPFVRNLKKYYPEKSHT